MIFNGSRYQRNAVASVVDPSTKESRLSILHLWPTSFVITYSVYVWVQGDRVDLLANHYYADPSLWWMLADANPEIMDWEAVTPGTSVRIPDA
jgi:phage tail protein X